MLLGGLFVTQELLQYNLKRLKLAPCNWTRLLRKQCSCKHVAYTPSMTSCRYSNSLLRTATVSWFSKHVWEMSYWKVGGPTGYKLMAVSSWRILISNKVIRLIKPKLQCKHPSNSHQKPKLEHFQDLWSCSFLPTAGTAYGQSKFSHHNKSFLPNSFGVQLEEH